MKSYMFSVVLFSFVGCAAQHSAVTASRNTVPAPHRYQANLLQPSRDRDCALRIAREADVKGAGVNVFLDGSEVVRIAAGETITLYLPPGPHALTIRPLFSPEVTRMLDLERDTEIALQLIDRNGNFEFKTARFAWLDSLGHPFASLRP
ncbi:MAG TPA: hypothetical protein VGG02_06195 [Chthoniobacterales bacterium]